jgi:hypoxanthine phosphoribosyltransferase
MISTDYKFLSWQDVEKCCLSIYYKMFEDGYHPESLVGLIRGGMVPTCIFSDFFGIVFEFYALDAKLYHGNGNEIGVRGNKVRIRPFNLDNVKGKKILIVDDIWDTGTTMAAVLDQLKEEDITTATLMWRETAPEKPNYYCSTVKKDEWVVFPWERMAFDRAMKEKDQ